MKRVRLKNIEEINRNLNKQLAGFMVKGTRGLRSCAAMVRRDMERTPPKVPVGKTGNLRASWFVTTIANTPRRAAIDIGFSAEYAAFVHEMMGANFRRKGAGAKYFESALKRNTEQMKKIIGRNMEAKK